MNERNGGAVRHKKIWLASGSPRRRELLARMGVAFELLKVDVEETASGAPDAMALLNSERKARAGAGLAGVEGLVLAADTLVALDGRALGKPRDRDEAGLMLRALGGRSHRVYTGVCLIDAGTGRALSRVDTTVVSFRAIAEEEICAYVDSGEPMDKAGAYAIQGGAGAFVAGIEGSFTNVMGLPVELLSRMLAEMGY